MSAGRRIGLALLSALPPALRVPAQAFVQAQLNLRRRLRGEARGLGLAQERPLPCEAAATAEIVRLMSAFLDRHYLPGQAQRAGNTKTHGVVRARFEVHPDIPAWLRHGLFAEPADYPAWVRFAGPGPLSPPDIDDVGILSIGVKVMGVSGPKLLDDERATQDFTGISAPTFTTATVLDNLSLQRHIGAGTPLRHFIDPRASHLTDLVMQALYARAHPSPLATAYWSCGAYLLGAGQAMQYRFAPRNPDRRRVPWRPSENYLREALAGALRRSEAVFDVLVQVQTDPFRMPLENASVVWPDRRSRPVAVATLRLPVQELDSPAQLAFADALSINPWHCLPEHRPLGNQNRARREIYLQLSRHRQRMNCVPHVEPTGDEVFPPPEAALGSADRPAR